MRFLIATILLAVSSGAFAGDIHLGAGDTGGLCSKPHAALEASRARLNNPMISVFMSVSSF